jgi:hypothetical protein
VSHNEWLGRIGRPFADLNHNDREERTMFAIAIEFQTGTDPDTKQSIDILQWAQERHHTSLATANGSVLEGVAQIRVLSIGSEKQAFDAVEDYCI